MSTRKLRRSAARSAPRLEPVKVLVWKFGELEPVEFEPGTECYFCEAAARFGGARETGDVIFLHDDGLYVEQGHRVRHAHSEVRRVECVAGGVPAMYRCEPTTFELAWRELHKRGCAGPALKG